MAKALLRMDKSELPVSTTVSFDRMNMIQDEKDVVSRPENTVRQAKVAPEMFGYPSSRIILYITSPYQKAQGNL